MKKSKLFTTLLTLTLSMSLFTIPAFASGGAAVPPAPEASQVVGSLTPDGNLTLVDDIKGEQSQDKQFITMQSKNGNYFYLVIDRAGDKEHVYFLNLVDEADLMALIEDAPVDPETPTPCDCADKCKIGAINTDCTLCSVDKTVCTGKSVMEPTEPQPEQEGRSMAVPLLVLMMVFLGGGAFYFLKVKASKNSTKTNLDDYDFDDDDDMEYRSEQSDDMDNSHDESEDDTQ